MGKVIDLAKEKQEKLEKERQELIASLETKRNELVDRLDKGAARIEEARAQGKNVESWTDYWIGLLRQYEKVVGHLAELGVVNGEPNS